MNWGRKAAAKIHFNQKPIKNPTTMAQQPSQEREGLYGVDVSSLRMRELLEAHVKQHCAARR